MNNQANDEEPHSGDGETATENSNRVNIQPSETDTDSEENAPGRTPGKAEGSSEIIEADLAESENQSK